jgi:two-component system sensor histidine kinase DegS
MLAMALFFTLILVLQQLKHKSQIAAYVKMYDSVKLQSEIIHSANTALIGIVENQVKERECVISNLYDNLGSMMVALKLNFENLKMRAANNSDMDYSLYIRSDVMIEEAYQKIRLLSYPQNEGTYAGSRLLPALMLMAKKASAIYGTPIYIESGNFVFRIGNGTELKVFQVIYLLLYSMIQHQIFSPVNISVEQYEECVTILVGYSDIPFTGVFTEIEELGLNVRECNSDNNRTTIKIDIQNDKRSTCRRPPVVN